MSHILSLASEYKFTVIPINFNTSTNYKYYSKNICRVVNVIMKNMSPTLNLDPTTIWNKVYEGVSAKRSPKHSLSCTSNTTRIYSALALKFCSLQVYFKSNGKQG